MLSALLVMFSHQSSAESRLARLSLAARQSWTVKHHAWTAGNKQASPWSSFLGLFPTNAAGELSLVQWHKKDYHILYFLVFSCWVPPKGSIHPLCIPFLPVDGGSSCFIDSSAIWCWCLKKSCVSRQQQEWLLFGNLYSVKECTLGPAEVLPLPFKLCSSSSTKGLTSSTAIAPERQIIGEAAGTKDAC